MNPSEVRVRFAPSPTGPLHIGGVRTALYNYLFARQTGGKFILRIEDTDQTRFVPGAEEYIVEALDWLGITFDEGVHLGGAFGPYRQSDRKSIYREYADKLLQDGNAYYAFDTPEELDALRKQYEGEKKIFQYDASTRQSMRNSLTLSRQEVDRLLESGTQYVVRFRFPENTEIHVRDIIRGEVTMNSSLLDDKVLFKSDGMPTYHLANIVDDHLMQITHVIRGEEWLPSAPLHIMLYRALGWEDTMPQFAHLPLLLKPDGNGKLSKRDGDRLGFPVFPLTWKDPKTGELFSGYREKGYFPEAVLNFLALLGWNPGTGQELFSLDEMVRVFSLERVSKAGAKFDFEKGKWFNQHYLRKQPDEVLAGQFEQVLRDKGFFPESQMTLQLCQLLKERISFVSDLWDESHFFFEAPSSYDGEVVRKRWKENTPALLKALMETLIKTEDFSVENLSTVLHDFALEQNIGHGQIMIPLRLSLVGAAKGPDLPVIVSLLGKEEVLLRIRKTLEALS